MYCAVLCVLLSCLFIYLFICLSNRLCSFSCCIQYPVQGVHCTLSVIFHIHPVSLFVLLNGGSSPGDKKQMVRVKRELKVERGNHKQKKQETKSKHEQKLLLFFFFLVSSSPGCWFLVALNVSSKLRINDRRSS